MLLPLVHFSQVRKPASKEGSKPASKEGRKPASKEGGKPASRQRSKESLEGEDSQHVEFGISHGVEDLLEDKEGLEVTSRV